MNGGIEGLWQQGGRWYFLGDAITLSGERRGGFLALLREQIAAAYPESPIELIAAAKAGDRLPELVNRLEKEVLPKLPSLVVAVLGVTDVWYASRGNATPIEDYRAALERMVVQCQTAAIPLVICTPMLIGERIKSPNSFDGALSRCAEAVRDVARTHQVEVIDLYRLCRDELARRNSSDRAHGILTIDGIHPNEEGARFVAAAIAQGLGFDASRGGERLLRHVVLFKYKPEASLQEIKQVGIRFRDLQNQIPGIVGFECGVNNSPEGLSAGFTHAYVVTFESEAARDRYLPHPAHQRFVESIKPLLAEALVVDFWVDHAPGQ